MAAHGRRGVSWAAQSMRHIMAVRGERGVLCLYAAREAYQAARSVEGVS